jgi:hypothetical protein
LSGSHRDGEAVRARPNADEQDRILREAAARLSLLLFEQEREVAYRGRLADAFISGYLDGSEGAALDRAVDHHSLRLGTKRLAAFAYGWCRGHADLKGHRPTYDRVEQWLSRRGEPSGG